MSEFDHLETIADSTYGDPTFDTPKGRSRKFRLASRKNVAKLSASWALRPKWKRELERERGHLSAGRQLRNRA